MMSRLALRWRAVSLCCCGEFTMFSPTPLFVIFVVLIKAGANLEAVDQNGKTPLLQYAYRKSPLLLQEILNQRVNTMAEDHFGQNAVFSVVDGAWKNEATKVEWCDQFVVIVVQYIYLFLFVY